MAKNNAYTVRVVARRYEEQGLEPALYKKPRPGKQRALDVGQSQRIIAMVCGSPPQGRARWSVRLIRHRSGQAEAGAAGGPGDDPHPAAEPRTAAVAGKKAGVSRNGMRSTLPAWKTCWPCINTIHPVMDNLSSHNRKALADRFGEKIGGLLWERFTLHYTPKHGRWLNQAEIEVSLFSRQCLGQRRIPTLGDLRREAWAWNRKINRDHVTINWQFPRTKARQKFGYNGNTITRSEA